MRKKEAPTDRIGLPELLFFCYGAETGALSQPAS